MYMTENIPTYIIVAKLLQEDGQLEMGLMLSAQVRFSLLFYDLSIGYLENPGDDFTYIML